jgi:hypothetical protein
METISGQEGLPKALKTLSLRTIDLVNNIIMAETDFDAGCKKLGDCVTKMRKGLEEIPGAANDGEPPPPFTSRSR